MDRRQAEEAIQYFVQLIGSLYKKDQETEELGEKLWVWQKESFEKLTAMYSALCPKKKRPEKTEIFRKFFKNNIHSFWLGFEEFGPSFTLQVIR